MSSYLAITLLLQSNNKSLAFHKAKFNRLNPSKNFWVQLSSQSQQTPIHLT